MFSITYHGSARPQIYSANDTDLGKGMFLILRLHSRRHNVGPGGRPPMMRPLVEWFARD